MKNQRGYITLVQIMILMVFGLIVFVFMAALVSGKNENMNYSVIGGYTERTCIEGRQFIQSYRAIVQVLDEQGHAVACH